MPSFGSDYHFTVLEGTRAATLEAGPGHYAGTALPGEPGNFGVAGHRVGRGAPFNDLDQLRSCEAVVVETASSWFVYRVLPLAGETPVGVPACTASSTPVTVPAGIYGGLVGRETVEPSDGGVIAPVPNHPDAAITPPDLRALLTLTTCTPKFSASQRMIIHATLVRTMAKSGGAVPLLHLLPPPRVTREAIRENWRIGLRVPGRSVRLLGRDPIVVPGVAVGAHVVQTRRAGPVVDGRGAYLPEPRRVCRVAGERVDLANQEGEGEVVSLQARPVLPVDQLELRGAVVGGSTAEDGPLLGHLRLVRDDGGDGHRVGGVSRGVHERRWCAVTGVLQRLPSAQHVGLAGGGAVDRGRQGRVPVVLLRGIATGGQREDRAALGTRAAAADMAQLEAPLGERGRNVAGSRRGDGVDTATPPNTGGRGSPRTSAMS